MRIKDDKKKDSIKQAVIKLILQEGFHGASISKIAREAGVSPATVYIYYENKDVMLYKIYIEYANEIFLYPVTRARDAKKDGNTIVYTLIQSYYEYLFENRETFNFVDQFSGCPVLSGKCTILKGAYSVYELFDEMKQNLLIRNIQNDTLMALLFSPVRSIFKNRHTTKEQKDILLDEFINIIQGAIVI